MTAKLVPSEYAGWLIREDYVPDECGCCCHEFAALVYQPYDPMSESRNEDFISCWCAGDCCDHSPHTNRKGTRVEYLPEFPDA